MRVGISSSRLQYTHTSYTIECGRKRGESIKKKWKSNKKDTWKGLWCSVQVCGVCWDWSRRDYYAPLYVCVYIYTHLSGHMTRQRSRTKAWGRAVRRNPSSHSHPKDNERKKNTLYFGSNLFPPLVAPLRHSFIAYTTRLCKPSLNEKLA